ncbi:MAG: sigma-70 family RNA polymerase sigma factor [Sedimentisphaerales bacterium]|nr:sigma-70 family RNA polymerase sigma factor [Sedimentisphaerales bacterium]
MANDAIEIQLKSQPEVLDEDKVLIAKAKENPEAAGKLYDKYYSEILSYIYHCTLDGGITEDLTSNVFLAAFMHLGRFKWRQIPFKAWLYRIATNEVRMHWRRKKRIVTIDESAFEMVSNELAGSENVVIQEEYKLLHKALSELKLKYRTIIILRYFEDKTISEICDITGSKEGTIKSQLHRGLAKLQDILIDWGVLPE